MVNLEKIKTFITGKTELERRQEMAANEIIRKRALAASLRTREKEAIRFAQAKEKKIYNERLKNLNKPKQKLNYQFDYFMGTQGSKNQKVNKIDVIGKTTNKYKVI